MSEIRVKKIWAVALLITGWTMIVLGPVMIVAGAMVFIHERNFVRTASRTQATIVEMVEMRNFSNNPQILYSPVYVFYDSMGKEQKVQAKFATNLPTYKVGNKITVLYNPRSPREAQIETFIGIWGWTMLFIGIGILDTVIGPLLVFFVERQKEKATSSTPKLYRH